MVRNATAVNASHNFRDLQNYIYCDFSHASPFHLKGDVIVGGRSRAFFKTPAIGLDKLDAVADELECAPVLAIICCPFILIEHSDHSDSGSLMEIGGNELGQLSKTAHLDPVGVLLF